MLDAEVNNGGFHQYFFNSAGDHAVEALEGLRNMGAEQTATLLQKGIALFGGKGPSPEREKRMAQLDKFSSKAEDKLGELDEQFYKSPDKLQIKLLMYAAANAPSFTTNK